MLPASADRSVATRSGLSVLSIVLLSGILASVSVPGKFGQRFRMARSGRQLDEARILHDWEAPASLDARFSSHAALEHLSGFAATLHHAQPLHALPVLRAGSGVYPPVELASASVAWDAVHITGPSRRAFRARPPPAI